MFSEIMRNMPREEGEQEEARDSEDIHRSSRSLVPHGEHVSRVKRNAVMWRKGCGRRRSFV